MEYHILYVESRKSLKGRKGKCFISLPSAAKKTLGKEIFAECQLQTLGKVLTAAADLQWTAVGDECFIFAECFPVSTRQRAYFAECLIDNTRQRS